MTCTENRQGNKHCQEDMKTNDKNRCMNKESTKLTRSALKNTDKQSQSKISMLHKRQTTSCKKDMVKVGGRDILDF